MKFRVFYELGNDRCTEIVEAETPGDAAKIIQEREQVAVRKVKAVPGQEPITQDFKYPFGEIIEEKS